MSSKETGIQRTALTSRKSGALTVSAVGIGAAGVVAGLLVGSTLLSVLLGTAGFFLLLLMALRRYRLRQVLSVAPPAMAGDWSDEEYRRLRRALSKIRYFEGVEKAAERALTQLEELRARYRSAVKLLDSRFERTELTYDRYLSACAGVVSAALFQLNDLLEALEHLRLLKEGRSEILQERETRVAALLESNDQALRSFDRMLVALAEMKTTKSHGSNPELEILLKELEELAKRSEKYSSPGK